MAKRFPQAHVIVLMQTGEQRLTRLPVCTLHGIGRALRDALEAGPVRQAVVTSNEGIYVYNASEVTDLAENQAYR